MQDVQFQAVTIETAYGVKVDEGGIRSERPDAEEAWVLHWPDANLIIPWPLGMTLKEAVREWFTAALSEN